MNEIKINAKCSYIRLSIIRHVGQDVAFRYFRGQNRCTDIIATVLLQQCYSKGNWGGGNHSLDGLEVCRKLPASGEFPSQMSPF